MSPDLDRDGACHLPGAASAHLPAIKAALSGLPTDRAGVRIHGNTPLRVLLAADGAIGRIAATVMGNAVRPVRALLFDKTPDTNWALGWHQDRTIVVETRREVAGFGPWTIKRGLQHVAPPQILLADMRTMRIHIDPVSADNAPLLIASGSHRLGRIAEPDIAGIVECRTVHRCVAERGDIWLYATPILHASDAAARPGRRRVLQVDFAATDLPGGLAWQGI